jgi:hypothetical protein
MAHFNVTYTNSKGKPVSASEPSGVHTRGWHSGVNVEARETADGDVFYVWMTAGSDSQHHVSELLGVVKTVDNSPVFFDHLGRELHA